MPKKEILDYDIAKETGGDYAGMYGARVWRRGERTTTAFVLGENASIHEDYDSAFEWVEDMGAVEQPEPTYIMVFPDGDTYNSLPGCEIRLVPDEVAEELDHGDGPRWLISEGKLPLVTRFGDER